MSKQPCAIHIAIKQKSTGKDSAFALNPSTNYLLCLIYSYLCIMLSAQIHSAPTSLLAIIRYYASSPGLLRVCWLLIGLLPYIAPPNLTAQPLLSPDVHWLPVDLLPPRLSGRMTDVIMPPNDTLTIYAGAASGGLWRSRDKGNTWQAIFDQQPCLPIGDIALAPSDPQILYVGTGEANGGGGSLTYDGCGIFRSDDGGDTWASAGLPQSGSIGQIAIHPHDPQTAYAAAMGTLFANSPQRGIFKTTDGGQTWTQLLSPNDSTGAIDVVIHPRHPDTVFAALWQRTRRPNARQYGGKASGIYRSTNGGKQWQHLSNGLPTNALGRISIAIAPNKPDRIYALIMDEYGDLIGLFRSNDAGNTWQITRQNSSIAQTNGYGWWFGKPVIDPDDADRIYLPLLDIWQTDNGGNRWTNISEQLIHYDQHSLFIHPLDPQLLVAANDGGIYLSRQRGKQWQTANQLPVEQLYALAQDPRNPNLLYIGLQDNGVVQYKLPTIPKPSPHKSMAGIQRQIAQFTQSVATIQAISTHGDGVNVAVSDTALSPYRLFYAFQYGDLHTKTDTGTWHVADAGIYKSDRCAWKMPIIYSPAHRTFLCATQSLYCWNEKQQRWRPWGNRADFSNGGDGYNFRYGTVNAIAAATDTLSVYVGTDDGNIWATHDSGKTFTAINANLPALWVNTIALHPADPKHVCAALSSYRSGKSDTYIYRTHDSGQTWQSIAYNLPKGTEINQLQWLHQTPQSPAQLVAATNSGIYLLPPDTQTWLPLGQGLPAVPIMQLHHNATQQRLIAATYGRGIYWATW